MKWNKKFASRSSHPLQLLQATEVHKQWPISVTTVTRNGARSSKVVSDIAHKLLSVTIVTCDGINISQVVDDICHNFYI